MRLGKIVTLLLAGFLTFSSLNSLAATKNTKAKSSISTKKQATSEATKKGAISQSTKKGIATKTTNKKVISKSTKKEVVSKLVKKDVISKSTQKKSVSKLTNKKARPKAISKPVKVAKQSNQKTVKQTAKTKKKTLKGTNKQVANKVFQTGIASYYANYFNGRRTANGETFNNAKMTAAHRTLPFGTLIEVTNLRNGRSVVVRVNDRGPYAHSRVLDLSAAAAKKIGMHHSGTARVKIAIVDKSKLRAMNQLYVMN